MLRHPPSAIRHPRPGTRYLWLLVAALFSLVVALIAGILKVSTGAGSAETVLYSGTAFAASMVLCLFLSCLRPANFELTSTPCGTPCPDCHSRTQIVPGAVPMVPILQLFAHDVPGVEFPKGKDLLRLVR
ncbi:hypothetical protein ACFU9X_29370 [Streptomyces atratus]|uniref:hypothetical protein n=1 Tax=Streptomyces atratus TaxID=1893 RepID=UPI00369A9747